MYLILSFENFAAQVISFSDQCCKHSLVMLCPCLKKTFCWFKQWKTVWPGFSLVSFSEAYELCFIGLIKFVILLKGKELWWMQAHLWLLYIWERSLTPVNQRFVSAKSIFSDNNMHEKNDSRLWSSTTFIYGKGYCKDQWMGSFDKKPHNSKKEQSKRP